eukprot:360354-Chlamydomonas_euryale.AAC.7
MLLYVRRARPWAVPARRGRSRHGGTLAVAQRQRGCCCCCSRCAVRASGNAALWSGRCRSACRPLGEDVSVALKLQGEGLNAADAASTWRPLVHLHACMPTWSYNP